MQNIEGKKDEVDTVSSLRLLMSGEKEKHKQIMFLQQGKYSVLSRVPQKLSQVAIREGPVGELKLKWGSKENQYRVC